MNWFKNLFKKKRSLIYGPGRMVPEADYNLLRVIRMTMAEHGTFVVDGTNMHEDEQNRAVRNNARILYDYYEMDRHEVLVATGIWLEGIEDEGTSSKLRRKAAANSRG